ncbi:hypothetical protein Efla_005519 [Eimeria flavescens]
MHEAEVEALSDAAVEELRSGEGPPAGGLESPQSALVRSQQTAFCEGITEGAPVNGGPLQEAVSSPNSGCLSAFKKIALSDLWRGPLGAPQEEAAEAFLKGEAEGSSRRVAGEAAAAGAGGPPHAEERASEEELLDGKETGREALLSCPPPEAGEERPADIGTACRQTFIFGNEKAGMEMTEEEKARIAAKIFELSRHSPFYANEMRKSRQLDEQIAVLRRRQQLFMSAGGCPAASAAASRVLQQLQQRQQQHGGRVYVHVDMDMFFCAVEMRDDPSLASKPMAVGSLSMLATANYAARRFGVRSAMPGFIARQLCPSLLIVKPNFRKYKAAGEAIRRVLKTYDPGLSSHSLDEASLDVTDYLRANHQRLFYSAPDCAPSSPVDLTAAPDEPAAAATAAGEPPLTAAAAAAAEDAVVDALVSEIRAAVSAATCLSCSAGAAPSRLVAKIASDMNKPNGQKIVGLAAAAAAAGGAATPAAAAAAGAEAVKQFLSSLNVRKLPGIGKYRERLLDALEIQTCGQLVEQAPLLLHLLPRVTAVHLLRLALGIDSSVAADPEQQQQQQQQQSVSCEETFAATGCVPLLKETIRKLAASVAAHLRKMKQQTNQVTLKVKFADFSVRTLSHRLTEHTEEEEPVAAAACGLLLSALREQQLKKLTASSSSSSSEGQFKGAGVCVRLLGVRCAGLKEATTRSCGNRRLDEFFSQQQQTAAAAAAAGEETAEERDSLFQVEELDDLLSVLSQQEHEQASTAAGAAAAGKTAAAAAQTAAAKLDNAAESTQRQEAAAWPAAAAAAAAPAAVPATQSEARGPEAAARAAANTMPSSSSSSSSKSSSKSSSSPVKPPRLSFQQPQASPQKHQQQQQQRQRRRGPSPPIHRQLKLQKRQQAAQQQQQQLLALFKRKRQQQPQKRELQQPRRCGVGAAASNTEIVEIVSD